MESGWVTEPGWRYTWDALGWIDTAGHVCKQDQAPIRAKRRASDGYFVCKCGSVLKHVVEISWGDKRMEHECKAQPYYTNIYCGEDNFKNWRLHEGLKGQAIYGIAYCPYCGLQLEPLDEKVVVSRQKLEHLMVMTEELTNLVAYGPASDDVERVAAAVKAMVDNCGRVARKVFRKRGNEMSEATLKKKINAIGYNGDWRKGGEETFLEHALLLIELGLSEEKVLDILGSLYCAVSSEFGA